MYTLNSQSDSEDEPQEESSCSSVSWDCGGQPATFRTKTPRLGELETFLSRVDSDRWKEVIGRAEAERVFGVQTKSRRDTQHFSQLLCGLSENISKLVLSEDKAVKRRSAEEIVRFLSHVMVLTERRLTDGQDLSPILDLVSDVVMELETLSCTLSSGHHTYELQHVWYEVRWNLIQICLLLSSTNTDKLKTVPEFSSNNCLEQLLLVTCLDLLYSASVKYESLIISPSNISLIPLFLCPCVEEFWLCIFSVCKSKDINFWSLIELATMDGMDTYDDCSQLEYQPSKPSDEMLQMFVSSFVTLLHSSDLQVDDNDRASIHRFIKKISKSFLKEIQRSPDELRLRTFLTVLRHVGSKIGPSLDVLTDLWKYFSSESTINNSCRLKTMTLDGQTSIPVSSSAWLEMIENISQMKQPSSFMIFVQICHQSLTTWRNNLSDGRQRI